MISNIEADPMANALYFGRVSTFSGCGQILGENGWAIDNQTRLPMHFAHGGSGILMTNKAVAQLDERAASCSARHAR